VIDFIRAPTWAESKGFLEAHLELLHPDVDAVLQQLAIQCKQDATSQKAIEEHRLLLVDCRVKGIEAAFAEFLERQNPAQIFADELNRICNEVVATVRTGETEQRKVVATRLEQILEGDLPLVGAPDFLQLLIVWLRGQPTQALEERLQAPFRDVYTQMLAAVDQTAGEDAGDDDGLTLEKLPDVVSSAILQGTTEQRDQLAASLAEAQQRLPPEAGPLGAFFGCLGAALRGETSEVSVLESPFTEMWQAFQEALSMPLPETTQQEEEQDG
jgi:hypothetical protein